MQHFVTYFDMNYLTRGLAMLTSLERKCSGPYEVHVVCMDNLSYQLLSHLKMKHVVLTHRAKIEAWDEPLSQTLRNRSVKEYLWTLTPAVILWILEQYAEIQVLTYLDADQFFFSDPVILADELGQGNCMIHEHRFSPGLEDMRANGIYNVGVLSFRRNAVGFEILNWWKERCIEWCYEIPQNGMMGDQGYLNDWPQRFPGVFVTQHQGIGLAPWNMAQYRYTHADSFLVEGKPVVVYHFHDFKLLSPAIALLVLNQRYFLPESVLRACFLPYLSALVEAYERVQAVVSGFEAGCQPDQLISPGSVVVAHRKFAHLLKPLEAHRDLEPLDDTWIMYPGDQLLRSV